MLSRRSSQIAVVLDEALIGTEGPFEWNQKLTLMLIAAMVVSVAIFEIDVGMAAITAAAILTLCRAADEEQAVKSMPWNVILMVSGVTVWFSSLRKKVGWVFLPCFLPGSSPKLQVRG